ncbi:uncharacterized protein LOC127411589 [Myxocyprinus asiaticus]|uniref:uncharacterized protein LOC127411589 n=1 Tax=Myxocyprinus asiaticus TaxID=70543 RepID=UPI0022233DB2|nr:uncharacterized protein LOC127411589 [Myxocyprinus asiaticus]
MQDQTQPTQPTATLHFSTCSALFLSGNLELPVSCEHLSGTLELPVSCEQSGLHSSLCHAVHPQHPGTDRNMDTSRGYSNTCCSLQQLLLLSHPSLTLGGGSGQLTNFLEELDVLLSSLPEDGRPLVVLGDFNIHQDKPQATELNTLLDSFDLEKLHTTATHRSGNQLDLIFTCQHVLHHPAPGCLTSFVNIGLTSGQLRGDGGNLKIQQI